MTEEIKILSMNVRGLYSNKKKRLDLFKWAHEKKSDITCFQETHSTSEIEKDWECEWGNKIYFSHCNSRSAGVCVLIKNGLDIVINDYFSDNNGRFIVMDISVKHQRFTLVSLYGYNTDEQEL